MTAFFSEPQQQFQQQQVLMNSRKRNAYSMPMSSSSTSTPNEFSNSAKLFVRHQNNRRFVAANDSSNDESSTAHSRLPAVSRKRHVALDENFPSIPAANDESHSSTALGDTNSIYSNVFEKRRRRFAPAIVDDGDDDVTNDDDDDDNDPVINGEALAAAVINDVELDQPNMQLVPYQRFAWQQPIVLGDRRVVTSRLKPSMLDLSPAYPLLVRQTPVAASADDADSSSDIDNSSHPTTNNNIDIDVTTNAAVGNDVDDALAAISEPPSPWTLMPIGGHGDGTRQFFEVLPHAARLSIVRVVPDDSTPLELLQSVDSWSPSFAQASSFLQQNAMSFPNLNLNFAYEGTSGASRQLVVASNVTQNALWPTAAAFNRETNELVILVSGNRRQFPWAKVAQAFE
jgi:hypothetical protein